MRNLIVAALLVFAVPDNSSAALLGTIERQITATSQQLQTGALPDTLAVRLYNDQEVQHAEYTFPTIETASVPITMTINLADMGQNVWDGWRNFFLHLGGQDDQGFQLMVSVNHPDGAAQSGTRTWCFEHNLCDGVTSYFTPHNQDVPFSGYEIDAFQVVINSVEALSPTPSGQARYLTDLEVRIYGARIPEPRNLWFFAVAAISLARMRYHHHTPNLRRK